MPVTPTLGRQRQENQRFKVSLVKPTRNPVSNKMNKKYPAWTPRKQAIYIYHL